MNALCADEAVVGKSTRSMMFRIVHHRHTNLEAYFGQKGAANVRLLTNVYRKQVLNGLLSRNG